MTDLEIASFILKNDFAGIEYYAEPDVTKAVVQSPEQLIASQKGHCWEQTELARHLFEQKNIPTKTFFMDSVCDAAGNTKTHTFIVFQSENDFYWFEHSWTPYRGIHRYGSIKELISDVKNKIAQSDKAQGLPGEIFRIREYDAPKLPTSHMDYFYHCLNGIEIECDS